MAAQITDEYAAGIIEARGKLYTNTGGTQRRCRPKVDVYLLDHRVAQVLLNHFGCGKVEEVGSPSHAPNKRVYVWKVKGAGAVARWGAGEDRPLHGRGRGSTRGVHLGEGPSTTT